MPLPYRILVADDSPVGPVALGRSLRETGFEVHEATDGRVALDLCRVLRPDLLVLGLDTPPCDSRQVLRRVRSDPAHATMSVLVLCDGRRAATADALRQAGATDVLPRALQEPEVLVRVRDALREKAHLDSLLRGNRRPDDRAAGDDALTGLPNRRACVVALREAARRAGDRAGSYGVAILAVDHLRSIGAVLGPEAADGVLAAIAGRLRGAVPEDHIVGRWAGEEFLAILPAGERASASDWAEGLRASAAREPVQATSRQQVAVALSVGWAAGTDEPPVKLLERADAALRRARADGRNCVRAG